MEWAAWLVLAALFVLAAWLRGPMLTLGLHSDEVGTMAVGGFWAIADHPENGVNPPLWRLMFNLVLEPGDALWWGRRFSLLCSMATIPVGYAVGRQASGGSRVAGLLAAALLATHPWCLRYAALFRIYAFWSLTFLVHVGALGRAVQAETDRGRRGWGTVALVTAILLPWIHYFSVPVLLACGAVLLFARQARRWLGVHVAAAVGILPMVPYVLFEDANRVSPSRGGGILVQLLSLDLHPPLWAYETLGRVNVWLTGDWPDLGEMMANVVLLCVAVGLLAGRRLPLTGRLLAAATLGVFVGAILMGRVQLVRSATLVLAVTAFAPLVGAVGQVWPWRIARGATTAVLGLWILGGLPHRVPEVLSTFELARAPVEIVDGWRGWEARRRGRPVVVDPPWDLWTVYAQMTRRHPRNAPTGPECEGHSPCFVHGGVGFLGMRVGEGAAVDALVVSIGHQEETHLAACEVFAQGTGWRAADCTGRPRRAPRDAGSTEEQAPDPPMTPALRSARL